MNTILSLLTLLVLMLASLVKTRLNILTWRLESCNHYYYFSPLFAGRKNANLFPVRLKSKQSNPRSRYE